jgi:hypothetical protein
MKPMEKSTLDDSTFKKDQKTLVGVPDRPE